MEVPDFFVEGAGDDERTAVDLVVPFLMDSEFVSGGATGPGFLGSRSRELGSSGDFCGC